MSISQGEFSLLGMLEREQDMIKKISNALALILQSLIALLLFGDLIINVVQVITRYVFDIIFVWCEDISTLSLCYMVSFGIPWLCLTKNHVFMDVLDMVLPEKGINFLKNVVDVATLIGGTVILYIGIKTVNVNSGYIYSMLRYDEKIKYIPLIITGIGMMVAGILNIIEKIQSKGGSVKYAE